MLPFRSHPAPASAAARSGAAADRIGPRTAEQLEEARALDRLFRGPSDGYEEHCRRSGDAESRELCAAASRYRQERSLALLLSFGDLLDELGIAAPARRERWT